jgi:hypothetical protein
MRRLLRLAAGLTLFLAGCDHEVGPTDRYRSPGSIPRPARITARQAENGVFLTWEAPDSDFVVINGWHIYKKPPGESAFRLTLTLLPDRFFTDRAEFQVGLTGYFVTSVSRGGVESLPSDTAYVRVDEIPPSPPVGLTATPQTGAVLLMWHSGFEDDLGSYRVYRDGSRLATVSDPDMPVYLDFTIVSGRAYAYYVTAVDFQGHESAPSDTVMVTAR